MVALPSLVEFRCVFRVRLTCFHRVCRTINARPRNNNGINHPARCWLQRSIYSRPIDEPRDRIESNAKISLRVNGNTLYRAAINLFIGRICKYPFPSTAKQLSPFSLPSPPEHLPSSLPDLFLVPKKRKYARLRVYRCRGCILRDARKDTRRCKARK